MRTLRHAVLIALVALALTVVQKAEAQTAVLTPDVQTLNLVRGTKAEQLPVVTYRGSYSLGVSAWTHCRLSVTLSGPVSGLQPILLPEPVCRRRTETAFDIEVRVKFVGIYTGGTYAFSPIRSANVLIYNGTEVEYTIPVLVEQITLSEVVVSSVSLTQVPDETVEYKVLPKEPTVGSPIYIIPVGNVNVMLTLDRLPTVPPSLTFKAVVFSVSGSSAVSTRIDFLANETSKEFTLAGIALESSIQYDIFYNDVYVQSGILDLSSVLDMFKYGKAMFTVEPPSLLWRPNTYYAHGGITVLEIRSASLTVRFTANGNSNNPQEIKTARRLTVEVSLSEDRPSTLEGEYLIVFSPASGGTVPIAVSFSISYAFTSGKFLTFVFFTLFNSLLGASLFMFFFGFFMRRVDLMGYGMLTLIVTALLFGIPTIMSHVVQMVVATGIEDPIGLQNINMLNLGEKLDRALEYVVMKGNYFSNVMRGAANALIIVLGALAAIVTGGGALGLLTGGALSSFLGQTLGAFASQIANFIVRLYLGSLMLSALTAVFPIFINVIIMLLVFAALMQATFVLVTHNLAPLVNTVMSLSMVIMLVFLAPLVIATLDRLYYEQMIWVGIGPIGFYLPINPFMALAIAIIEIIFIAMILGLAFHRLMAAMHSVGAA